ncbi:hypothetical protein SEA_DEJAVU_60 [Microbacterium Phage DejaVu]|nr:hypothetical protein LUPINE_57 [Microbacterium phage Lupine]QDH92208.1 hypothetical protein SEA_PHILLYPHILLY_58 [Microbacterium phage PhillyPhilly]QDK03301.1 hypothetical protein SEA_ROMAN_59 [Microbacterium phage Roman]UVG34115.1 membrane protein [Microbacterium phage Pavlo]WNM66192.1 hypothetical protein SEA_DEJAVU_60 [Microbacterium Phage DejaVu]
MAGFEFLRTFEGLFTTIGVLLGTVIGSYWVFRGKRGETQVQATQVTTESTAKFLDGQREFQKYVNEAVRSQVEEATSELRGEVAELAEKLSNVTKEYDRQSDIFRLRETRLWAWDNVHDRKGPIPALPDEILHKLSLGHLINLSAYTDTGKMDQIAKE